jgi:hypothetical protein
MDPLGRQKRSRKKTSTNVIAHPATKGIFPSKFSAIAEPTTSAISVAMMAASDKKYRI